MKICARDTLPEITPSLLPMKKKVCSSWHSHLKQFSQTEGKLIHCGLTILTILLCIIMIKAGKLAMLEGPGQLNKAASTTYQQLTTSEKETLKVEQRGKVMTLKEVMKRSDQIFSKIQKMVSSYIKL